MRRWRSLKRWILLGLALTAVSVQAQERSIVIEPAPGSTSGRERRIALVIGNAAYKSSPLRNPVNDARAMSRALSEVGFKVEVLENASQSTMRRAARKFGDDIAAGGVGLFYYAGHGMQVKGRNFLIPVNAEIEREDEIEDQAVDAQLILGKMETAKNQINLMILDACRNNPFARSFRSGNVGLAQMDAPSGTLVAFATAPGSVASDGAGQNGLYTEHLVNSIKLPGLPVEQVFKRVRIEVTKITDDRQVPWESSSLKGEFFFRTGGAVNLAALESERRRQEAVFQLSMQAERQRLAEALKQAQADRERILRERAEEQAQFERERLASKADIPALDLAFWNSIKDGGIEADYEYYLRRFPKGAFVELARKRIVALQTKPIQGVAATPSASATGQAITPFIKPIEGVQLASIAPGASVHSVRPADLPVAGDQWDYQFADAFKKVKFSVQVASVSGERIEDRIFVDGKLESDLSHAGTYSFVNRSIGGTAFAEFSPYWRLLEAKSALGPQEWRSNVPRTETLHRFRTADVETVKVPAGEFKARRATIESVSMGQTQHRTMMSFTCEVWSVPEIKRIVKMACVGLHANNRFDGFTIELASFKLQ